MSDFEDTMDKVVRVYVISAALIIWATFAGAFVGGCVYGRATAPHSIEAKP